MGHLSRWMHSDIQVTLRRIGLAIAGMIFIFTIYDIFHHLQEEGQISIHSLMEGIFLLGMTVIILAIRNSADQEFSRAARELSQTRQELDRFRIQNHDLMHDYRKAVQEQF
jgi:DNA-binding PadR family transcriptional regulator